MIGKAGGRTLARISGHVNRCSRNSLVAGPRAGIAIVCERRAVEACQDPHVNDKIRLMKAADPRAPLGPYRQ